MNQINELMLCQAAAIMKDPVYPDKFPERDILGRPFTADKAGDRCTVVWPHWASCQVFYSVELDLCVFSG